MTDDKQRLTYAFALLALSFLALGLFALNDISIYTPDSTRYVVWSRSLASFAGYVDRSAPETVRYVVHAPLYAVLLFPAALVAPGSILAAKALTLLVGVLMLWLAYRWFERNAGRRHALLGTAVLACNPLLFLYSTEVLSDVPFAAAIVLSWILLERVCAEERFRPGLTAGLALSVAAGLLLREIGIALLLSTVAYLLLRRRYREAGVVFAVPAMAYAAWYIRNELVVAPLEDPPLTNSRILTYHFMTPRDASLLDEFGARILVNLTVYAGQVRDLLFAPVYFSRQYDVIPAQNPLYAVATTVLSYARYPMAFFGLVSTAAGLLLDARAGRGGVARLLFLGAYAAVALCYPINDIRFLLPILVMSVFYCLVAWQEFGRRSASASVPLFGLIALFLLPNLLWDLLYADTSAAYQKAPATFSASVAELTPTHFMKPFRPAGEWIRSHTDSGAVVVTQWKDLALWVGDRKVLNVDQTVSPEDLDNLIRDYGVAIIVSQRRRSGIAEFDVAMHQSRRYAFPLRDRIGSTEIYGVMPKNGAPRHGESTPFEVALNALEGGRMGEADTLLTRIAVSNPQNVAALYMLATTKALEGRVDEADSLFALIRTFPQAGIFVARASQQQQLLRIVASADTSDGTPRAELLASAATGYWNAGWRSYARVLLNDAIGADSTSATALIAATHLALREGDLAAARSLVSRLAAAPGEHPLMPVLRTLVNDRESAWSAATEEARAQAAARVALTYAHLGLTEDAISAGLEALAYRGADRQTAFLVADLYLSKRRFSAAERVLRSRRVAGEADPELEARLALIPER